LSAVASRALGSPIRESTARGSPARTTPPWSSVSGGAVRGGRGLLGALESKAPTLWGIHESPTSRRFSDGLPASRDFRLLVVDRQARGVERRHLHRGRHGYCSSRKSNPSGNTPMKLCLRRPFPPAPRCGPHALSILARYLPDPLAAISLSMGSAVFVAVCDAIVERPRNVSHDASPKRRGPRVALVWSRAKRITWTPRCTCSSWDLWRVLRRAESRGCALRFTALMTCRS
jgi:hypothetical protein